MSEEPSDVVIFMDNFDSPEKDVVLPDQTSPEPNKDDGGKDSRKSAPKQRRRSAPVDRRRSGMRRRSSRGISGGDLPGGRRRRRSSQKAAKRTLGESEAMVILRPLQLTHTKRVPLGRHEIKSFKSVQRTEVERHKSSKGFTMVLAEYTFDHDSKMFFVHGERKMKKILEQEEEDKKSKEEKQSQDATSFSLDSDFESDEEDNAFEARIQDIMQWWLTHPRHCKVKYRDTFGFRATKLEKPVIFAPPQPDKEDAEQSTNKQKPKETAAEVVTGANESGRYEDLDI